MSYERIAVNPGSSAEFYRTHLPRFEELSTDHEALFETVANPAAALGHPATAEVVEQTNSQPPTPDTGW